VKVLKRKHRLARKYNTLVDMIAEEEAAAVKLKGNEIYI
jgi:hypothetical protein